MQKFWRYKKDRIHKFWTKFLTRSWTTNITISDNIYVKYWVDDIGKNRDIGMVYYIEESRGKQIERKIRKKQ